MLLRQKQNLEIFPYFIEFKFLKSHFESAYFLKVSFLFDLAKITLSEENLEGLDLGLNLRFSHAYENNYINVKLGGPQYNGTPSKQGKVQEIIAIVILKILFNIIYRSVS